MISEELKLVIKAEVDKATADLRKFQTQANSAKTGMDKLGSGVASMAAKFGAAVLSIAALNKALHAAWDAAKLAAQANQVRAAFTNMAESMDSDADDIIDALRRASGETIDDLNLMQAASRAAILGIPMDDLEELMNIARASATALGEDVTYMFDSIVTGIGRASPMILDNLGIIVDQEEANKAYAAAIGKTVEELTKQERSQALLNAVLKSGGDIMERVGDAGSQLTDAEVFQQLGAAAKNLAMTLGDVILPSIKGMVTTMTSVLDRITGIVERLSEARREAERMAALGLTQHVSGTTFFKSEFRHQVEAALSLADIMEKVRAAIIDIAKTGGTTVDLIEAQAKIYEEASNNIDAMLADFVTLNELHPDEIELLKRTNEQYKQRLEYLRNQLELENKVKTVTKGGIESIDAGKLKGYMATGKTYASGYADKMQRLRIAAHEAANAIGELNTSTQELAQPSETMWLLMDDTATATKNLGDNIMETAGKMEEFTGIADAFSSGMVSIFDAIGESLILGEDGMKNFGKAFTLMIADMLTSLGKFSIQQSAVFAALKALSPAASLAAGIAALAVAGVLKAAANKMDAGGMLNEPVVGVGTRTGRSYAFAENRPEIVGHGGGGSGMTIIIQGNLVTEQEMYSEADRWRQKAYRRW